MKRLRNWLLAACCAAPLFAYAWGEWVRPAWAQCPGVNCIFNGVMAIPSDGIRRSYSASVFRATSNIANPSVLSKICGSSTATVRVTKVTVSGRLTTAVNTSVQLAKYSTGPTQGTDQNITPGPYDSTDSAATTTPIWFQITPLTSGTLAESVESRNYFMGNLTTTASEPTAVFTFGNRPARAVVLRGTSECLTIQVDNTQSYAGGVFQYGYEWTEE